MLDKESRQIVLPERPQFIDITSSQQNPSGEIGKPNFLRGLRTKAGGFLPTLTGYPSKLEKKIGHLGIGSVQETLHQQIVSDYLLQGGDEVIMHISEVMSDQPSSADNLPLDLNNVTAELGNYFQASFQKYQETWYIANKDHRITEPWDGKSVRLVEVPLAKTIHKERLRAAVELPAIVARTVIRGMFRNMRDVGIFNSQFSEKIEGLLSGNTLGLIGVPISYPEFLGIMTIPDPLMIEGNKFSHDRATDKIARMDPVEVYQNVCTYLGTVLANRGLEKTDKRFQQLAYDHIMRFESDRQVKFGRAFQIACTYIYNSDTDMINHYALHIPNISGFSEEVELLNTFFHELKHPHRIVWREEMLLEEKTRVLNPQLYSDRVGQTASPLQQLLNVETGYRNTYGNLPATQSVLRNSGENDANLARLLSEAVRKIVIRNWQRFIANGSV